MTVLKKLKYKRESTPFIGAHSPLLLALALMFLYNLRQINSLKNFYLSCKELRILTYLHQWSWLLRLAAYQEYQVLLLPPQSTLSELKCKSVEHKRSFEDHLTQLKKSTIGMELKGFIQAFIQLCFGRLLLFRFILEYTNKE